MPRHLHFTKFVILSFALHALMIAVAFSLIRPDLTPLPISIPVNIVNLPGEIVKKLPPVQRPAPPVPVPPVPVPPPPAVPRIPQQVVPDKPYPRGPVPMPDKFGSDNDVALPKTGGARRTGIPGGAEEGKEKGGTTMEETHKQGGPLPFLSQNDIDELARRGMPEQKPGEDSVTLDTDEFKFMSYNRWLKIKVESVLKYPELAAISGYQGTLFIRFDIMQDGSLGDFEVLKSSGYKILDDEAERAIRASAPFQPLPKEWRRDRYSIRAAVIFYLGSGYIR